VQAVQPGKACGIVPAQAQCRRQQANDTAFEKPVRKSPEGYAEPSKTALKQYAQQVYACYADAPAQSFAVGMHRRGSQADPPAG